jgi:hypothetical protein
MLDGHDGIEVEGLVRGVFKGGVRAVDGIDLRVAGGEVYGPLRLARWRFAVWPLAGLRAAERST